MSEARKFTAIPLAEQLEAIEREADIAQKRLPHLARKTNHGRPPKLHEGVVKRRLNEFENLRHTFRMLKRLEDEGRLPPELSHL
jgi:hypothetical protein